MCLVVIAEVYEDNKEMEVFLIELVCDRYLDTDYKEQYNL